MSNEPLIVAARRRAKMLSRQTGASYQTQLDVVAREAGRDNWIEFLKDPVAVASDASDVPADIFAAPASLPTRHARRWPRRLTIVRIAVLVIVLAALVALAVRQQGRLDEMNDQLIRDRMDHGSADWLQKNIPIARNVQLGDMHIVDLVFMDSRPLFANWMYLVPKAFGYDPRIIYGGRGENFRETLRANPIMMVRMHANCRIGKWRMAAMIATTSYDAEPASVEYLKRQPVASWPAMTERNRHAICDKPDTADFNLVESPTKEQYALQTLPAGDPARRSDAADTQWYGIDLLHPRYLQDPSRKAGSGLSEWMTADEDEVLTSWLPVETPPGWTEAGQDAGGLNPPINDETGPTLALKLKTKTPEAAKAAAWLLGANLAKRFDLGPHSGALMSVYGRMYMKVRFSAVPRRDRPMSSTLRLISMRQDDEGVELRITMRGRYARDVRAWRRLVDI